MKFKPGEMVLYLFSDQIRIEASVIRVLNDGRYQISTEAGKSITVESQKLQKLG